MLEGNRSKQKIESGNILFLSSNNLSWILHFFLVFYFLILYYDIIMKVFYENVILYKL